MDKYSCWIVVLVPSVQDVIVAEFVKNGFKTGPLSSNKKVCNTIDNLDIIGHTLGLGILLFYEPSWCKNIVNWSM